MNASELVKEKAQLLARIAEIDKALALLESPARPVEISTRRNLRNTWLGGVTVYEDESLTVIASPSAHGGFVTAQDAGILHFAIEIEDGYISVY